MEGGQAGRRLGGYHELEELGCLVRRDFKPGFSDVELDDVHIWNNAWSDAVKQPDASLFGYIKRAFVECLQIATEVDVEERRLRRVGDNVDLVYLAQRGPTARACARNRGICGISSSSPRCAEAANGKRLESDPP